MAAAAAAAALLARKLLLLTLLILCKNRRQPQMEIDTNKLNLNMEWQREIHGKQIYLQNIVIVYAEYLTALQ